MFSRDSEDGIYLVPDDEKLAVLHALIIGPDDTPYEGGFFYFYISLPASYPIQSPSVKLMTTDQGHVRFNPNLYACGKVCLSILGTWAGPSWTAVMTIHSVLLSIRSLMCEKPYFNEPGYEGTQKTAHGKAASDSYNREVRFNTMKTAIWKMVGQKGNADSKNMPEVLKYTAKKYFMDHIEKYKANFKHNLTTPGLLSQQNIHEYDSMAKFLEGHQRSMLSYEEIDLMVQLFDSIKTKYAPTEKPIGEAEKKELVDLFLHDEEDCIMID